MTKCRPLCGAECRGPELLVRIYFLPKSSTCLPYLVSMLNWLRSRVSVALLSPWVSAPRDSSLFATTEANRFSPANSDIRNTYSGALTWLERWVRPGKIVYKISCKWEWTLKFSLKEFINFVFFRKFGFIFLESSTFLSPLPWILAEYR